METSEGLLHSCLWKGISLLRLSRPLEQGSAQAITSPPDAVFYICDVSGDPWPCTVLDGKHSTINSE